MKTIMVTGASGDIGKAVSLRLLGEGWRVIGVVRSEGSLSKLADAPGIEAYVADVTRPEDLRKLAAKLPEKIDWIVASHGFIDPETSLEKERPEDIEKTFQVNVISLLYLAQAFLSRVSGGMVFISSTAGIAANGRYAAYSASKAGVNSLSQALARNRAEQTFVALCPGPTAGKMRESIGATGGQNPDEVAKTVSEIVSAAGTYKSGDIVSVRDGKTTIESRLA